MIPAHIAIIPDGNRRWAKREGKSVRQGHKAGYDNVFRIADAGFARGVRTFSVFCFSTENWNRTAEEIGDLLDLLSLAVMREAKRLRRRGIAVRVLGSRRGLSSAVSASLDEITAATAGGANGTLGLAFNYGGRRDIAEAVQRIVADGTPADQIDEQRIASSLSTAGLPDPDLIIRTSGEHRTSNFMIWEGAYSELYFSPKLWPEFGEAELDHALADYAERQRRFGA